MDKPTGSKLLCMSQKIVNSNTCERSAKVNLRLEYLSLKIAYATPWPDTQAPPHKVKIV